MPLPSLIQAIQARFRGTNNNAWNATTNPLGMGQGGHRQNMPPRLNDIADVLSWQAESFDAIATARTLTGQDASNTGLDRIATAQTVLVAAKWASNGEDQVVSGGFFSAFHYMRKALLAAASAAAYAAGLNLPAISSADAGKVLMVKPDGSGYVTSLQGRLPRVARTANVQIVAEDRGKFIDVTAGTFTQTFASAVALGDGFFCYLRNSGDGDVTLDPDGSETIDGLTVFRMYPGEVRLIQGDGATLRSIVVVPFFKVFTASDTFIKPPGYSLFRALIWSAGASGARCTGSSGIGYGGNGGGCFPVDIPASVVGAAEAVTVGAGGAPATVTGPGNAGGGSSFCGVTVAGGNPTFSGGVRQTSEVAAGSIGFAGVAAASNGYSGLYGGGTSSFNASGASGNSLFGGAAGGTINSNGSIYPPGTSDRYGGSGGAAGDNVNGTAGSAPGGGGGGTRNAAQSGAGARGEVRVMGVL